MPDGPPPRIRPRSADDYLEQLSKSVFQAGISWRVVDTKWPGIKTALHRFRLERVARMSDREVDALTKDARVIRNRPKIAAIVHNARALLELERTGGVAKHLRSFADYEDLAADLKDRFKFVGDSGMYHFLWTVSHPVPDWRDWARAHGVTWGRKRPTATGRSRSTGSGAHRGSAGRAPRRTRAARRPSSTP